MTTGSPIENDTHLNYLRLRIALDRFEQPPAALSAEQNRVVEAQAKNAYSIEQRILALPEAHTVLVPPLVLEQAIGAIRARYVDPEAFVAAMVHNGLDEAALRAVLLRELKVEAVIERHTAEQCQISDEEVARYYAEHPERFIRPEIRTARQILITINPQFAENTAARARLRLGRIAAELDGRPERFEPLARQHSECPSAADGGRLGRIKRGMLYPNLDDTLFALPEDGISDILETEIGLHLLWCERIEAAGPASLEVFRQPIREALADRKRRLLLRELLS